MQGTRFRWKAKRNRTILLKFFKERKHCSGAYQSYLGGNVEPGHLLMSYYDYWSEIVFILNPIGDL